MAKQEEVAGLRSRRAELRRQAERASPARPFGAALQQLAEVTVIAEYKRRSPSAGALGKGDPAEVARAYAAGGARAVSVLTDGPFFGGSLADLAAVRASVELPVLRKDFVLDEAQVWEARAAGADAVLLIARILEDARLAGLLDLCRELQFSALVEVHDAAELERALRAGAGIIGVNNRDLETFATDLDVTLTLASLIPVDRVLVGESGIATAADVDRLGSAGVDAVLVGEALMRGGGVSALAGRPKRSRDRTPISAGFALLMRVKICGVCRPGDAAAAVAAGADYVGVILAPGRARTQSLSQAAAIWSAAPQAMRVGVFVDAAPAELAATARELGLHVLQLHGEEDAALVQAVRAAGQWRVWKAVRPRSGGEFARAAEYWAPLVDGLLVDGWSAEAAGGTGVAFGWDAVAGLRDLVPDNIEFVVAGGLNPGNVAQAVARLAPDTVDVSSGVESERGIKSAERVQAFVQAARSAIPQPAARKP